MSSVFKTGCMILWLLAQFTELTAQEAAAEAPLITFHPRPTPFLTYDISGSLVGGKGATTSELRGGLDFSKKVKLGIGWAWVVSDIVENKMVTLESGRDSVVPAELRLQFGTVSAEYSFFENDRWQITMPVTTGFGYAYFRYNESVGDEYKKKKTDKTPVAIFGPSGTVTYKLLRWVGVSVGVGYRIVFKDKDNISERLSSPIYSIKARIFFDEIYRSIVNKDDKSNVN